MRKTALAFATTLVLGASLGPALADDPVTAMDQGSAELGSWGVETRHISDTLEPGNDFFDWVNEGWLESTEIPAGFSRFGAFSELRLLSEDRVESIILQAQENENSAGTPEQQIGDLFNSYMDTEKLDALGLDPIRETLDELLAIGSHEAAARWMGAHGTGSLAAAYVTLDLGDPQRHVTHVRQSGLGMPDRDYYLRDEEPFPGHRKAYRDYIAATFKRAGVDQAEQRADAILDLETRIAENHWTRVQQRDRQANYRLIERSELDELAPAFPWQTFLAERGLGEIDELVMATDEAVIANADVFAETPADTWASWHAFHWINNHAPLLSSDFERAHFELFQRQLGGVDEQRPRDRRAINTVSGRLGELVGKLYVAEHFPPEYREQMLELVGYLRRAFAERLDELPWMDDETRVEAERKLESFLPKIGYPDKWRDYSDVTIAADDLIGNSRRVSEWQWADNLARLDEPVREWEWGMTPQTVNAYYSPPRNEIAFPAAILQPPFFDPYADPAVNFGAIGGVIGHEMGHGFDDQGSRSDADGVLRNWWTDQSREQFEERTARLVAQYNEFEPIEGMNVNGELALGENIGDLGGLSIALHAYRMYLADHHDGEAPVLDGYTGEQRFFMAWGQVWRNLWASEEALRAQLIQGPHSPPRYRVNGVVRNIDAWYDAFDVGPDHELYVPAEERVSIW
ncbi:M13 family metallopeptidase [Wenzhouxiangella sp. AB-CW3]|uniref:M13 family metallopeptidase n=1 Tax=Wenzhouxiangella sp. AB-CW3 TaxID=2771012 RepID=UPI00168AD04F|nr:M13 family metallopeptidase [Wenzhouxiangella sp. AB-CW3]QOC21465.1 M13 family metallopeptidase [Wenzhouxiangella sp. AB-CW3]